MYTRVHAQKKHVLCGRVDKRETQPKNKTSHSDTHGRKIRKRLKCVHAYMCTRSKKSQPYCVTLAYVLFLKNFWFTIHIVDSWFWRNTRCAWAGGTWFANYPDFFENHQFHVIYCVTLAYVIFSKNFWFTIYSHRRFMILKNNESVGPVQFSAAHLICRYVRTDGRINPGWAG